MHFVTVKPLKYKGRRFTVKPTKFNKRFSEINVFDYVRNLKSALGHTFESMRISSNDMKMDKEALNYYI